MFVVDFAAAILLPPTCCLSDFSSPCDEVNIQNRVQLRGISSAKYSKIDNCNKHTKHWKLSVCYFPQSAFKIPFKWWIILITVVTCTAMTLLHISYLSGTVAPTHKKMLKITGINPDSAPICCMDIIILPLSMYSTWYVISYPIVQWWAKLETGGAFFPHQEIPVHPYNICY